MQDANWNVTGVADPTGNVQERYLYTAYGLPTFLSATFAIRGSSLYGFETLFAGYRWDAETGLYLVRWRDLHGLLAWLSRDPLGHSGGWNLYAYVQNRPTMLTDPAGLIPYFNTPPCPKGTKKVPNPDFKGAKPNGCGNPFLQTVIGRLLNDNFNSPKCAADFTESCNRHDDCYLDCSETKEKCDERFRTDLLADCKNKPNPCAGGDPDYCKRLAWTYWGAVSGVGTIWYYIFDQRQACKCVPDKNGGAE